MYTVYEHVNKINRKRYIGITSKIPEERWGKNGNNYRTSPHFYNAINKYGWDNFEHNILYTDLSQEEACFEEKRLIALYKSNINTFGYNQTTGGETFTLSKEAKEKKSKAMIGNKNGLGKPCSKEKAKKISESQKGKIISEETKRKQSEKAKQRRVPCSESKRAILRKSYPNMKKVYCFETNIVYISVQECARQLGIEPSNVSAVCRGKHSHAHGYHLKYYDDTINA